MKTSRSVQLEQLSSTEGSVVSAVAVGDERHVQVERKSEKLSQLKQLSA